MSHNLCARRWEVEAARNGQLTGAPLAAHALHVTHCSECAEHCRDLEDLGRALRQDNAAVDELAVRRLRQRVMQRAAADPSGLGAGTVRVRWLAAPIAFVVVLAIGFLALRFHSKESRAVAVVTPRTPGTQWARRQAPDIEHIELRSGMLSLVVRRGAHDPRVIVHVPDGEIEDLGTEFSVSVQGGRTVRITVNTGAVVFRQHGDKSLRLSAGMDWERAALLPATSAVPVQVPVPIDVASGVPLVAPPARSKPRAFAPHVASDHVTDQGPTAAEAEDAAYLHVVALVREGRAEEARLSASAYLRAFPQGFRRPEMSRVAQRPRASGTP